MQLKCYQCNTIYNLSQPRWRCDCGGYLLLEGTTAPQPDCLTSRSLNLWRYHEALPPIAHNISIGEQMTPLTEVTLVKRTFLAKLDYLMPTGSYKDRGVSVMVSQLKEWGLTHVVEDSSGNAGSSVAAYCSKAGIKCDVYIPAYTSLGKAAQIALYGGNLIKVPGTREDTAQAALKAGIKTFYASHNWSPFFEHGVKTYVYEIWEQLGFELPDVIIVPCGNGSLVTSALLAINELRQAGLATCSPRIVAVQSENCAPLATAWQQGLMNYSPVEKKETIAEGIASARPLKGRAILEAVRQTNGCFITVSDDEVWTALQDLARQGILVEPTSATAPAAARKLQESGWLDDDDVVVIELTGTGLKATDKLLKLFA